MITVEQITQFAPHISDGQSLVDAINATTDKFEINTPRRLRYFLAQASFETEGFSRFVEDLYYTTASDLVKVWPTRFTMDQTNTIRAYAPDYCRNPEKLANLVYANRNGNGDVASGDGWNYKGGGAFGLTGRENYAKCSTDTYGDNRLIETPSLLQAYDAGMMSAGWFWSTRDLNDLADNDEFTKVTEIINGSSATVPDRLLVLTKANLIF